MTPAILLQSNLLNGMHRYLGHIDGNDEMAMATARIGNWGGGCILGNRGVRDWGLRVHVCASLTLCPAGEGEAGEERWNANGGDKEREAYKQQTHYALVGPIPSHPWLPKEVEDLWRFSTCLDLDKWHIPPTQPLFLLFIDIIRWMPHESHWKFHNFLQHGTLLLKSFIFLVFLLKLWNCKH